MVALDTNILVRVLTNDDAIQSQTAAAFIRGQDRVLVLKTVLLEIEWVLRSAYRFNREAIARGLRNLIVTANFVIQDMAAVMVAIEWFEQGMDLADALHLASTDRETEFATFDVALQRTAQKLGIARVIAI